jgi:hypothetical protein
MFKIWLSVDATTKGIKFTELSPPCLPLVRLHDRINYALHYYRYFL